MKRLVTSTINLKITLVILAALVLQSLVFVLLEARQIRKDLLVELKSDIKIELQTQQQMLGYLIAKQDYIQLQSIITSLGTNRRLDVAYFVDENQRIIASTRITAIGKDLTSLLMPEAIAGVNTRLSELKRRQTTLLWEGADGRSLYAATPVGMPQTSTDLLRAQPIGALIEIIDLDWIDTHVFNILRERALPVLVLLALITGLLLLIFHTVISRRIITIRDAARNFRLGTPLQPTAALGNDELGELHTAFFNMAQRVQQQHAALQQHDQRLAKAEEIAHLGSWEYDLQNNRLTWSEEVYRIFGLKPDNTPLTMEQYLEYVHPQDRDKVTNTYQGSVQAGRDEFEIEHRLVRQPANDIRYVHGKCVHIKDANGVIIKSQGMVRDITEQVLANRRLVEQQEEQARILNTMVEGVITLDQAGLILSVNSAAETMFGRRATDLLGQHISTLLPLILGEQQTALPATVIGLTREGYGRRSNGESFPLRLSVAELVRDSGPQLQFILTCLDITVQKQQEEQLRRSQKMDALGKLTGGIAHDFNNMLGVVLGFAELLKNELADKPQSRQQLQQILTTANRGKQLVRKLLGLTRVIPRESRSTNLSEQLQNLADVLQKTLTARVQLQLRLSDNLWPVLVDVSDLDDSLINMAINAADAMPHNGQLTIETRNTYLPAASAAELSLPEGEYVMLRLIDTGSGMNRETLSQIFEPFFTTKGDKGTGLGLPQVYGFVSRSNGAIQVHSEPGHGSEFTLYFPRHHTGADEITTAMESTGNLRGEETVLVVDDEIAMCELAQDILSTHGYTVITAHNSRDALYQLKRHPQTALLLSDVIMPNMNGYDLASRVSQLYPRIKIQLVSGYHESGVVTDASRDLHQHLLSKPYTSLELLQRIRRLLDMPVPQSRKRKVMVLDDDEAVRLLYMTHLTKLGYECLLAADGDTALTLCTRHQQEASPIDVAIIDLSLPGSINGDQVAKQILDISPQTRIIISSGDSASDAMTRYRDYGFHGALEKTFDRRSIEQALRQAINAS